MKKILFVSTALLFSASTLAMNYAGIEEFNEKTTPRQIIVESIETQKFFMQKRLGVKTYMRNFTNTDQVKVRKAEVILEHIMNSEEFKQRILNYTWKGKKTFNANNGLTNQEIYDHIMTGEEILMPDTHGVMNFDLTLYRSKNPWSKVKGYTTAKSMRIYMNKKFFRKTSWTSIDVAANMAHEWVHKMGYGHAYKHNADRPFTVPYAIGSIVGELAKEFGY